MPKSRKTAKKVTPGRKSRTDWSAWADPGNSKERKTMDLLEAARVLGIGKYAAYEAAARGEIPGVFRIGQRYLVSREAFDRAIATGTITAGHAA
jgi:excisionase family DNA binding protein